MCVITVGVKIKIKVKIIKGKKKKYDKTVLPVKTKRIPWNFDF